MTSEVVWRPSLPWSRLGAGWELVGGNMHMETEVIKVADVKSEVI